MLSMALATVTTLVLEFAGADGKTTSIAFQRSDLGKPPTGWTIAKTGTGEGSVWAVTADATAPSGQGVTLAQTAAGPTQLFNLCVLERSTFKDGEVAVAVRAVKGQIDQGGGVVWRYVDANNYYVCRYNPLEENFRVYHVKAGKRTQLATKERLDLPEGQWFTVSIRHAGTKIECFLNGTKHLDVNDATFPAAGKVGVWSKADAISHFDQFRFTPNEP
jgi:hypothetical protein